MSPSSLSKIVCPKEVIQPPSVSEETPFDPTLVRPAQRLAGEALWISQRLRPDISHAVGIVCSLVGRMPHQALQIGRRILAYLQATKRLALDLRAARGVNDLEIFSDASFAPAGMHSYGGLVFCYKGAVVLWKAYKIPTIALSSAEAELVTAAEGTILGRSLHAALTELSESQVQLLLHVDNQAAITIPGGGGSQRTRHLRVRGACIRQLIDENQLQIRHCPGEFQRGDLLTKPLPSARLAELRELVGLVEGNGPGSAVARIAATEEIQGEGLDPEEGRVDSIQRAPRSVAHHEQRARVGVIQQCLLALISLDQVQGSFGAKTGTKPDLQVESSIELYIVVVLIGLSVVCLWEGAKSCCPSRQQASNQEARVSTAKEERRIRRVERAVARALEDEGLVRRRPASVTSGISSACSSGSAPAAEDAGQDPLSMPGSGGRISAFRRLTPEGLTPPSPDTRILLNRLEREAASEASRSVSSSPEQGPVSGLRNAETAFAATVSGGFGLRGQAGGQGFVLAPTSRRERQPQAVGSSGIAQGIPVLSPRCPGQASASSAQARQDSEGASPVSASRPLDSSNQSRIQGRVDVATQTSAVMVFSEQDSALITVQGSSLHDKRCKAVQKAKAPQHRRPCSFCLNCVDPSDIA